jgi:hypothetical protein
MPYVARILAAAAERLREITAGSRGDGIPSLAGSGAGGNGPLD